MAIAKSGTGPVLNARMSRAFEGNEPGELARVSDVSVLLFSIASVGFLLLYSVAGYAFIDLLFGEAYRRATTPLIVLAAGQAVVGLAGPSINLLIMTRNEAAALRAAVLGGLIMIGIALLLVPDQGATGMAIASAIGAVTTTVALAVSVKRHLGFDPTILGAIRRFRNPRS
jgi:O-antigen/teichoic acid export membrane protein